MNNIWNKNVNIYNGAINSYIKMPSSSKIRGTLLAVNENKVKIGIGNDRALDIVLDKPFEGEVGDTVIIDRKNIVESKLVNSEDTALEEGQTIEASEDKYAYILKSCDIAVNDESIEAVKTLENYGVDMTKENILSFIYSKEQLSNIAEKLDYDTAVKLVEKDVDFEKESLQKVLQEMQNAKGDKRPFSLLRFLGIKKDMTTEEAEKIAYDLYGSKMGKDITDVIKALDKAGLETSKSNIEEINNVFSKLHDIKNIEDKTIVDSVKNKIETSIDNLYKLKNAVVKGSIKVEEKIGQLASKVYEAYSGDTASPVTERQLGNLEGDIRSRLEDMGIRVTEELVRLSKDLIARGLDLTRENLEKITEVKGAIVELNSNLDYEKTALLMASGLAVDKIDLAELANMINAEERIIENAPVEDSIAVGLNRLEILELIENIDIKTLALHTKFDIANNLESLNASQDLLDGNMTVDTWLNIIGDQLEVDYKLPTGGTENEITIEAQANLLERLSIDKTELLATLNSLTSDETMEIDRQAQTYLRSNVDSLGPIMEENYRGDMAKAIIQSRITLNRNNMQDIYMMKKGLDKVADGLTTDLLQRVAEEGGPIEKLGLNQLSELITSLKGDKLAQDIKTENTLNNVENTVEDMEIESILRGVDALKQISPERKNSIISLLMKNSIPMTLKQVQNLSFFLSNQRQIGHQLEEMLNLIDENNNAEITKIAEELENAVNKINNHIKEGRQIGERPYEEFSRLLKNLESKSTLLSKEDRGAIQKSGEKLLDSLELQLHLNREDTLLQLPLMMNDQLKNLQIYIMKDKQGSKKIDPRNMSVLLNFDTNNMGNVNIYLAVNYKNIVMKMGLSNKEDQDLVEKYSKELEEHLEGLGYDLKNLSFRIDDDNHILSMVEETEASKPGVKKLLDVRI